MTCAEKYDSYMKKLVVMKFTGYPCLDTTTIAAIPTYEFPEKLDTSQAI